MNPGAVEEGGKVATSLIDALKSQPATLAMIVLNIIFIGAVLWDVKGARSEAHQVMQTLLDQNKAAQELLSRCIVPKIGG